MPERKRICDNCRYYEGQSPYPEDEALREWDCMLTPLTHSHYASDWCGEHRYEGELSILPVWSRYDAWEDVDKLKRGLQ